MGVKSDYISMSTFCLAWGIVLGLEAIHGRSILFYSWFQLSDVQRAMSVVIGPDTGRKLHRILLQTVLR